MLQLFPLYWEKLPSNQNDCNIIAVQITGLNINGENIIIKKLYREWIGVCTNNIKKVVNNIIKHFSTCSVKYKKLSNLTYRKVLPYFKDRLKSGKLKYSNKPFYKVFTTANISDIGYFFNKYKIAYYDPEDFLIRIYIDLCTQFDTKEFYYKWYYINPNEEMLLKSLRINTECKLQPNLTIVAFDLETVPLDGENRIPTGHDETDRIVMISIVKWNNTSNLKKIIMYLNPIKEPLNLKIDAAECYEYSTEAEMLKQFHIFLLDAHLLTGYNVNQFDIPCIYARLVWLNLSELLKDYKSKKIGNHLITTYRNKIIIDMYNFIQIFSSYDLESLKLDIVAKCKIGDYKIPIKPTSIHSWYIKAEKVNRNLLLSQNLKECFQILTPENVKEQEFGTFLTCLDYCLQDSILVYKLFQHEMASPFLFERSNFTALNVEEVLYYGNSKYILVVLMTYGTCLGFFVNIKFFKNTIEEDSKNLIAFFKGKNSSTYQGALNFCTPGTFFKNVFVFDFISMYASILLNHNLDYGSCMIIHLEEFLKLPECIRAECIAVPYRTHEDAEFLKQNKFPYDIYEHPKIDYESDKAVMLWYTKEKGFLPQVIEHFLEKRLTEKNLFNQNKNIIHHNKQLNIKLFLNSIYGIMASNDTNISCLNIAMIITAFARIYLLASYEYFSARNFMVAYCDTDSIFVQDYDIKDATHVNQYLNQPYMILAFEQVMDYLLVISKKRYIYECGNKVKTKGFEKKANKLVKWMANNIIKGTLNSLKSGNSDTGEGWKIWVDTLTQAYIMCRDPKKYCITRKTKPIEEYKSKTCHQLKLLRQHPERAGQYIDFTYNQADISIKESANWIVDIDNCNSVNFEKLFMSQKKIFITLINIAFLHLPNPDYACNMVLNTMRWKNFLNAELKSYVKTGKNIMILIEKGEKYTFYINDITV